MKRKELLLISSVGVFLSAFAAQGFSQVQAATRIPQQIVVNGQRANGVYVMASTGGFESFTCSDPQHYTTPEGNSQGWACYEQASGAWLLNAVPPPQTQSAPGPVQVVPQQPTVIYPQQPTVIYQQPPTVIYQQPFPTIVYATPSYPVIVRAAYPSSVVLGRAAINAAGRVASAVIISGRHSRGYYGYPSRQWRR